MASTSVINISDDAFGLGKLFGSIDDIICGASCKNTTSAGYQSGNYTFNIGEANAATHKNNNTNIIIIVAIVLIILTAIILVLKDEKGK